MSPTLAHPSCFVPSFFFPFFLCILHPRPPPPLADPNPFSDLSQVCVAKEKRGVFFERAVPFFELLSRIYVREIRDTHLGLPSPFNAVSSSSSHIVTLCHVSISIQCQGVTFRVAVEGGRGNYSGKYCLRVLRAHTRNLRGLVGCEVSTTDGAIIIWDCRARA